MVQKAMPTVGGKNVLPPIMHGMSWYIDHVLQCPSCKAQQPGPSKTLVLHVEGVSYMKCCTRRT